MVWHFLELSNQTIRDKVYFPTYFYEYGSGRTVLYSIIRTNIFY